MADKKRKKQKAVAMAAVGVSICAALFATTLTLGASAEQIATKPHETAAFDPAALANQTLSDKGFSFASAKFENAILTISGDSPNMDARNNAFGVARDKILEDKAHLGVVHAFFNNISVMGQKIDDVPDAASVLPDDPDAGACQTSFNALLVGRTINFDLGSAQLSADGDALLDALAAVASKCARLHVEVDGHTDTQGDAGGNQTLSERRAQAVADALVRRSVEASQLSVVGFGESKPLDRSNSPAADAKNRRIEFVVTHP